MVISGPSNTDGSFMSFQMYSEGVESVQTPKENMRVHHSHDLGLKKSTHTDEPVQHQPSKLSPLAFLTSTSRSLASV
jgi:hypothetical protein